MNSLNRQFVRGCGKTIAEQELSDVEYVRTKRKTDIFFHRDCKNKIWR